MIHTKREGRGPRVHSAIVGATALAAVAAAPQAAEAAATVSWGGPPDILYPIGESVQPFGNANATGATGTRGEIGLALDSSGSMGAFESDGAGSFKSRREFQQDAANALVTSVPAGSTSAAIIDFDSNAFVAQSLTPLDTGLSDVQNAINGIDSSGGTDIRDGIDAASNELQTNGDPNNIQQVVLISDGGSSRIAAEQAAQASANAGIPVSTVALPGSNTQTLQAVANAGGGIFSDFSGQGGLQSLIDVFSGTGGNLVGLDRVEVTDPDGNTTTVSTDGLGNFQVSAFALEPGANTWTATAFATDGTQASADITLTAVPVPGALPLMATAVGGIAYWRRRQAKRAA
jgi:hypothetical protein